MPPQPTPVDVRVKVILDPPGNSPPDRPPFHFETSDLPMGPDNFLIFRNHNHPGFHIFYDLDDTANPGYRFPESSLFPPNPPDENLKAALYCAPHSPCPTSPSKWGQFVAKEVTAGGKTLKVHNRNDSARNFWYTLRVTKDGGATYGDLDPGGGNENGPTNLHSERYSALLFGVAVITGVLSAVATTATLAKLDLLM